MEVLDHDRGTLLDGKGNATDEPHYISVTWEQLRIGHLFRNSRGVPFDPQPSFQQMFLQEQSLSVPNP